MTRIQKQQQQRKQRRMNTAAVLAVVDSTKLRIVLLAAIAVAATAYLWIVNASASSGFYLTDLEQQRAALLDEQKRLQVVEADLETLSYIQEMSKDNGLVQTATAQHIDDLPSTVAVAE